MTWRAWETVLFHRIEGETGDVVDAVAITGEPNALAHTKSYYYTPSASTLLEVYLRTISRLSHQAGLGLSVDIERHLEMASTLTHCVGSRACANKPAVVDAVRALKKKLREKGGYETWGSFAEFHNLFTFYTVQMLAFATGYRAVTTPFLRSSGNMSRLHRLNLWN